MAHVTVEIFDDDSEELIRTQTVPLSVEEFRARWGTPAWGGFPLSSGDLGHLRSLGIEVSLHAGEVGYVQIVRDSEGETIVEPSGEEWYPPPG